MPEAQGRRRPHLWAGIAAGTLIQVVSWVWAVLQDVPLEKINTVLAVPFWATGIQFVTGLILTLVGRTRLFGGGLLLGLGIGIFAAGGVCVGLSAFR